MDVIDLHERSPRHENHSVYRIFSICGDFHAVGRIKALIFDAAYDFVLYQSFYYHCQGFLCVVFSGVDLYTVS